ncbi:MAG: hypothetical protein IKE33_01745 [Erysipelotrichaceae bacterium]|nr:hypothetical protein [Erysipelotrichaceae bacterium]
MAQVDYVLMEESNDYGKLLINMDVFKDITALTIDAYDECSLAKNAIGVEYRNKELTLGFDLKVKSGSKVVELVRNLQNDVYDHIFNQTGIKADAINIRIVSFEG